MKTTPPRFIVRIKPATIHAGEKHLVVDTLKLEAVECDDTFDAGALARGLNVSHRPEDWWMHFKNVISLK